MDSNFIGISAIAAFATVSAIASAYVASAKAKAKHELDMFKAKADAEAKAVGNQEAIEKVLSELVSSALSQYVKIYEHNAYAGETAERINRVMETAERAGSKVDEAIASALLAAARDNDRAYQNMKDVFKREIEDARERLNKDNDLLVKKYEDTRQRFHKTIMDDIKAMLAPIVPKNDEADILRPRNARRAAVLGKNRVHF